jgi:N-acetylglutamate synthase-like GNAT family acetyltransferase
MSTAESAAVFDLRPAFEDDFPAIRALIWQARINPTGLAWNRFMVAVSPEQVVLGCGQLKPYQDKSLELASIAVLPEWRGRGIGRALIKHLLTLAPRPVYLTCRGSLETYYHRFGFETIPVNVMPPYFRRISRLFRMMKVGGLAGEDLRVMRLTS